MIICSRDITLSEKQKLVIVPLGDVHHNAYGFDEKKWHSVLDWIRTTARRKDRQVLVLLMGDYLDTFSRSERKSLHFASSQHESTRVRIEKMIAKDMEAFLRDLEPIAPLISGVIAGNHTYQFQEAHSGRRVGKTVDAVIAQELNVPFLGICGALILQLRRPGSSHVQPFKIFLHHGFGRASSKPASLKQLLDLRTKFPAFNLYAMGHNHTPVVTVQQGIDVQYNSKARAYRMCDVVQGFVRSASFLKGYIDGEVVDGYQGSYVEEACLSPAGLGVVTANLRWKGHDGGFILHVQE